VTYQQARAAYNRMALSTEDDVADWSMCADCELDEDHPLHGLASLHGGCDMGGAKLRDARSFLREMLVALGDE
jgi:hypothetical protein